MSRELCIQLSPDLAVAAKVPFDEPHRGMAEGGSMAASLIGCLGQAHFPSFFWVLVTHPGHASLRSLGGAVMAPLHACVGLAVESLALRRALRCAAAIFGFFHRPRPVRDDPVRIGGRLLVYAAPPTWS